MNPIKNRKQLALEVTKREGKKKQVNIFQITEVLSKLAEIETEQPGALRVLGAEKHLRFQVATNMTTLGVLGEGVARLARMSAIQADAKATAVMNKMVEKYRHNKSIKPKPRKK